MIEERFLVRHYVCFFYVSKFPQELFLSPRHVSRNLDLNFYNEVTDVVSAIGIRHATMSQSHDISGLSSHFDRERFLACQGWDLDFCPKRGLRVTDRQPAKEILTVAFK